LSCDIGFDQQFAIDNPQIEHSRTGIESNMIWRLGFICILTLLCKVWKPSLCSSQCSRIDSREKCSAIGDEKSIILDDSVILKLERTTNDGNIEEVRNKINYSLWKYIEGGTGDGLAHNDEDFEIPVYSANCRLDSNAGSMSRKLFQPSKGHPVLPVEDSKLDHLSLGLTPAEASLPCMLYLAQSPIIPPENPGKGVFTKISLPKGLLFGPYKGSRIKILKKEEHLYGLIYAWKCRRDEDHVYYIDGLDENISNWLRFVNSARFEEEQNMIAIKDDESDIYYYLYKDVAPNTELLVYYGESFSNSLGIKMLSAVSKQRSSDFAPKRIEIECPVCTGFPSIDDDDI